MYLIDTNVISESRKRSKADKGVRDFFQQVAKEETRVFISVVTVGELRRGVELIRHRGDLRQADRLAHWLDELLLDYREDVLGINTDIVQVWGHLRVPQPENAPDKLIAATGLIYDLTVVTRNQGHFVKTGVRLLNPFAA